MKLSNLQVFSPKFLFLSLILFALAFSGCGKMREEYNKGMEKAQRDAGKAEPTPAPTPITLSAEKLNGEQTATLDDLDWKYQPGDDASWAEPNFDDSGWDAVTPKYLTGLSLPKNGWNGIGWFRLPFQIDESLVGEPLSLEVNHPGASDIYVDGKLVRSFGKPAAAAIDEQTYNPNFVPLAITFEQPGAHTLAVRYSNTESAKYVLEPMIFQIRISSLNQTISGLVTETALRNGVQGGIFGICLAMGLLHLLLFVLYPQQTGNIFYSIFLLSQAANVLILEAFVSHMGTGAFFVKMFATSIAGGIYYLSFAAYLYVVLENRIPRYLKRMSLLWLTSTVLMFISYLATNRILTYVAFALAMLMLVILIVWHLVLILIVIIRAISRKVDSSLVLGVVGFSFIASAIISTVLVST